MVDFSDKIVKFFIKLDNFSILNREKHSLTVGTTIVINESKGISRNPMHPAILTKEKRLPVFFFVETIDTPAHYDSFSQHGLPRLFPSKEDLQSLNAFKKKLDKLFTKAFYN
jgi:hypothetical protein